MQIFIGADHGGFNLKNKLIEFFAEDSKFKVTDCGAYIYDETDDYPIFAKEVCEKVQIDPDSLGILICRTGIGMSIVANKYIGIYAALCCNLNHAQRAKEHNNANILCLDSEFISEEENIKIVKEFIDRSFNSEERHVRRIQQIQNIEVH